MRSVTCFDYIARQLIDVSCDVSCLYRLHTTTQWRVMIIRTTHWRVLWRVAYVTLNRHGLVTLIDVSCDVSLTCHVYTDYIARQLIDVSCDDTSWVSSFAKETYNFKEPTNRSHPISSQDTSMSHKHVYTDYIARHIDESCLYIYKQDTWHYTHTCVPCLFSVRYGYEASLVSESTYLYVIWLIHMWHYSCVGYEYRVAKTHRIPHLYRSFSAKVTHV